MFTPERTALVVLAASLLIFAAVVMCSRSSLGEPIPMAVDSVFVIDPADPADPPPQAVKSSKRRSGSQSKPKGQSQSHPKRQKLSAPARDHWHDTIPQN